MPATMPPPPSPDDAPDLDGVKTPVSNLSTSVLEDLLEHTPRGYSEWKWQNADDFEDQEGRLGKERNYSLASAPSFVLWGSPTSTTTPSTTYSNGDANHAGTAFATPTAGAYSTYVHNSVFAPEALTHWRTSPEIVEPQEAPFDQDLDNESTSSTEEEGSENSSAGEGDTRANGQWKQTTVLQDDDEQEENEGIDEGYEEEEELIQGGTDVFSPLGVNTAVRQQNLIHNPPNAAADSQHADPAAMGGASAADAVENRGKEEGKERKKTKVDSRGRRKSRLLSNHGEQSRRGVSEQHVRRRATHHHGSGYIDSEHGYMSHRARHSILDEYEHGRRAHHKKKNATANSGSNSNSHVSLEVGDSSDNREMQHALRQQHRMSVGTSFTNKHKRQKKSITSSSADHMSPYYCIPVSHQGPEYFAGAPQDGLKTLVIIMVGLPARGKTFLAQKICRLLGWHGCKAKVLNVQIAWKGLMHEWEKTKKRMEELRKSSIQFSQVFALKEKEQRLLLEKQQQEQESQAQAQTHDSRAGSLKRDESSERAGTAVQRSSLRDRLPSHDQLSFVDNNAPPRHHMSFAQQSNDDMKSFEYSFTNSPPSIAASTSTAPPSYSAHMSEAEPSMLLSAVSGSSSVASPLSGAPTSGLRRNSTIADTITREGPAKEKTPTQENKTSPFQDQTPPLAPAAGSSPNTQPAASSVSSTSSAKYASADSFKSLVTDPNSDARRIYRNVLRRYAEEARKFFLQGGEVMVLNDDFPTPELRDEAEALFSPLAYQTIYIEVIRSETTNGLFNELKVQDNTEYPDHVDEETAKDDFTKRVEYLNSVYVPLAPETGKSYIQIRDSNVLEVHKVTGFTPSRIVSYAMNLTQVKIQHPIFFVRHGQSMFNLEDRIGGNPELTEKGHEDSRLLLEFVSSLKKHYSGDSPLQSLRQSKTNSVHCDDSTIREGAEIQSYVSDEDETVEIWTSQLQRAIQTAEPCERLLKVKTLRWSSLNEIHAGVCEGMTYADVREKYPLIDHFRKDNKYTFRYPRGESYQDIVMRLEPVIMELENADRVVVVVAHQAVLRALLAYFGSTSAERCVRVKVPQRTVWRCTYDSKGIASLEEMNLDAEAKQE